MEWIETVNFNLRKPNFIILHHTAQDSIKQTIKTFTLTRASQRTLCLGDNGVLYKCSMTTRAWHAGTRLGKKFRYKFLHL
jgi:N-acetylmuramoyl-L-alanine amidase